MRVFVVVTTLLSLLICSPVLGALMSAGGVDRPLNVGRLIIVPGVSPGATPVFLRSGSTFSPDPPVLHPAVRGGIQPPLHKIEIDHSCVGELAVHRIAELPPPQRGPPPPLV